MDLWFMPSVENCEKYFIQDFEETFFLVVEILEHYLDLLGDEIDYLEEEMFLVSERKPTPKHCKVESFSFENKCACSSIITQLVSISKQILGNKNFAEDLYKTEREMFEFLSMMGGKLIFLLLYQKRCCEKYTAHDIFVPRRSNKEVFEFFDLLTSDFVRGCNNLL